MSDANPTVNERPVLVTIREAALATGVPIAWLRKEVDAGRIPCLRFGRRVRVSLWAVNAALERQAAGEYADSLFGALASPAIPDSFVLPESSPVEPERNPRVGGTPGTV